MRVKKFFVFTLVFSLLLSAIGFNASAADINMYTVQYLDKVTNQAIVPPVISAYSPSASFTVRGQVSYNGYQLDSVQINAQAAAHSNGAVTIASPAAGGQSIVYFYNDIEAPRATVKQYAYFELGGDNDPAGILANLYDNGDVSNVTAEYAGTPPDTSSPGIKNAEIELSDRSGNKTVLKGEAAVVGTARYIVSFKDSATDKDVRETIVAPLTVGENKSLQFSFPAGYELISVSVDGAEQQSGTVVINSAEDRNYDVIFNMKDAVPPEIKTVGQSSFQKGENAELEKLFITEDNSGGPVALTGNISTGTVGTFNAPITAKDAAGNYTSINFSYTVYGTNAYTVQYINKLNNQDLLPRTEPVQFNTNASVTITLPTAHSGFTLAEIDLGTNQSKAAVDLKNGRVTLTNLTDEGFVCKGLYLDTTKPIGTARTDNKIKEDAGVNPMQCLASVYDNSGIEGLTAYFSGQTPDTNKAGVKSAVVFLKDKAGNVSDPINVTVTVEGDEEDENTEEYEIKIRYIDDDTDRVIETDTVECEEGDSVTRGDLDIPSGYKLVSKSFTYSVTKDATIDVPIVRTGDEDETREDGEFTITVRYVNWENTGRLINTQEIAANYGQSVEESDLKLPEGYGLYTAFSKYRVYGDDTLTVKVKAAAPEEITVSFMDGTRNAGSQTLRDYTRDTVQVSDLILPDGYTLADPGKTSYPKGETVSVAVKRSSASITVLFIEGTQNAGSQTLKDYTRDTVQVSDMILPNGYALADPGKTSYTKAETISVAVKRTEISVYIVRRSKPGEHSDAAVPGKSNDFKILQTYKSGDGANISAYSDVLELVTDTKTNTWYYIVADNGTASEPQPPAAQIPAPQAPVPQVPEPNPIGSSIQVEITDGIVYVAAFGNGQHTSYIDGYEMDGRREFRPDQALTRAEFSALVYNNFISPFKGGTYTESSFADVSTDSWYFQPVEAMTQLYIINGYEENVNGELTRIFKPDEPITRAEAATLLSRIRNVRPKYTEAGYNDIPEDAWYKDYVYESASLGYFRYVDGEFKPQEPMTRRETIFAFNAAMDRKPFQASDYRNPFEDLSPTHPYYADIMEAVITHDYIMDGDTENRPGN